MPERICSRCDEPNRPEARFCDSCGNPLALTCPACSAELRAKARFCDGCGAPVAEGTDAAPQEYTPRHLADKILNSRSALEGERKQVTVLFADVKGSLELARSVDPEDWHQILDRFFQVLSEGVHRFEGTVNQYTGDGIMALFGAPISHEDHAQRACYAALALRDKLEAQAREVKREFDLTFSTRIGIHSGEVVVGKIGDDLRMDYTAQGLTVGLAARMEELAAPGTIYLSHATTSLVSGYFDLEDLGEFPVKGMDAPVRVHQLSDAGELRTRFDVSRARGLTRFVGRASDMETLDAALEQCIAGNGQIIGVVAEAGTGKSRLCFEFLERCRAKGLGVHEGRSVAHGKNIPFLPMLQVFRSYFGIDDRDDPRTVREKIAGRLLLMDEEFRDALPLLFEVFGAPDPDNPTPEMDADTRQRQLFGVLRRATLGEGEPRVSLIEDLHWMDSTSKGFLEEWVEAVPGGNGLLIVNFRPEFHAEWMARSWYRQIPLTPLGPEAVQELLDDLLGTHESVLGLAQRIHGRTGGNPFFTEEIVQSLVESGRLEGIRGAYRLIESVDSLEIPATVTSLLASRIDRLSERDKHVLQAASVLGKEFNEPILEAISDLPRADLQESLASLKAGEFVYEQSLYPVAEYTFKHPLTQEVALGSQLSDRRQTLHASAARALDESLSDKLDENAALLAHHWEEAGQPRQAIDWHRRAAEWVSRSDAVAALRHWQRVRELGIPFSEENDAARLCLMACRAILVMGGWRMGLSDEELDCVAGDGRALGERLGDRASLASIIASHGLAKATLGDVRTYYRMAQEASNLIDEQSPLEDRIVVRVSEGYSAFCYGHLEVGLAAFRSAYEMCQGDPRLGSGSVGFSALIWGVHMQGEATGIMGRLDETWNFCREAIGLARRHGFGENLLWALGMVPTNATYAGSVPNGLPEPRAAAAEGIELAEAIGSNYAKVSASFFMANAERVMGDFERAEACAAESLSAIHEFNTGYQVEPWMLSSRSDALRRLGRIDEAIETAQSGIEIAATRPVLMYGIDAQLALARALLAKGGGDARDKVETCLQGAANWLAETGARTFAPQIAEVRAELAAALGNSDENTRLLGEALALYREIGAHGHAERLATTS